MESLAIIAVCISIAKIVISLARKISIAASCIQSHLQHFEQLQIVLRQIQQKFRNRVLTQENTDIWIRQLQSCDRILSQIHDRLESMNLKSSLVAILHYRLGGKQELEKLDKQLSSSVSFFKGVSNDLLRGALIANKFHTPGPSPKRIEGSRIPNQAFDKTEDEEEQYPTGADLFTTTLDTAVAAMEMSNEGEMIAGIGGDGMVGEEYGNEADMMAEEEPSCEEEALEEEDPIEDLDCE